MSESPRGIGLWLVAVIPIVCCAGLPLLLAVDLGVGVLALIGGITVGAVALAAAIALFVIRARSDRGPARRTPSEVARRSS